MTVVGGGTEIQRRVLVDRSRRDGSSKSLSVEVMGGQKFFWATTGLVTAGGTGKVYLTLSGEANGDELFTKVPSVQVLYDNEATAGGFLRGQGPMVPSYTYDGAPHAGWNLKRDTVVLRWYVEVSNTLGSDRDFVVSAQGL